MDATALAQAEHLYRTAERLSRVGLVFDRTCLSPEQRRVLFTQQRLVSDPTPHPEPKRDPIGFAYPNAR